MSVRLLAHWLLLLFAGTVLLTAPRSALQAQTPLAFSYQMGGALPPAAQISISSGTSALAYTVTTSGAPWLTVTPATGSTPALLAVAVNPSGLAVGAYSAAFQVVTSANTLNYTVTLTVTPAVQPAPQLIVSPPGLSFAARAGDVSTPQQTLAITSSGAPIAYTVTPVSPGNWLTVAGGIPSAGGTWSATTPATLTVTADPRALPPGNYTGFLSFKAPNAATPEFTVTVVITISPPPPNNLLVSQTILNFAIQLGGVSTVGQSLAIASSSVPAAFTITPSQSSWLSLSATQGTTPASVLVNVNPSGLAAGNYTGTLTINGQGVVNNPQTVTVNISVRAAPLLSLNSTAITLLAQSNGAPVSQDVQLIPSGGNQAFQITAVSAGNWLSVSPSNGVAPAALTITANPAGLGPGTVSGILNISVPGSASTPLTATVTLTIGNGPPVLAASSVVNAASFNPGISPASWVSIFGQNLARTPAPGRIWRDSEIVDGALPVTLDGVSVKINGRNAAVYFVSSAQLNVQAPDDNASGPVTVEVTTPDGVARTTADMRPLAPGLFTLDADAQGRRYAAARFLDGIVLGRPEIRAGARIARPGDWVQLYGTAFGATTPSRAAGRVAEAAPLLAPYSVRIGGLTSVTNFGGIVAPGLYQFNAQIPDLPGGDYAVTVDTLGLSTQAGVLIPISR